MTIYNNNIPQPSDLLTKSQGDILNNFKQLDTSFGKDHYTFSDATANNGKHKQAQIVAGGAIPVGLTAGENTIYSKSVTLPGPVTSSEMFVSPDASGDEYQLTVSSHSNIAEFATSTNYPRAGAPKVFGGWTFLPGGLLLQYGFTTAVGTGLTINFPIVFTLVYSVVFVPANTLTNVKMALNAIANDKFSVTFDTNSQVYWQAIGKA